MRTDYQFNQINSLAKMLALSNEFVADKIHNKLFAHELIEFVESIHINGQIVIVFNIKRDLLGSIVNTFYQSMMMSNSLPKPNIHNLPSTVVIDFSSPNIAKEMHVGHLRSTIIGESLSRIFEYSGSNVKRVNHIGDWGTQFGMLIAYVKRNMMTDHILSECVNDCISELMQMYKESKKMFDSDNDFNLQAHAETVKLQQGDAENIAIWKKICDISITSFNKIYHQLSTHAEIKGESFYQSLMVKLVEDLSNIIVESNGMKVLFGTLPVPMIIAKSDGGFTYDTSDLAALRYRITEEKADLIIYVVDSGQQQHFETLFEVATKLGFATRNQLKHVGFGLVLGLDGKKLKTRSGETILLRDLLDLAYEHSKKVTATLATKRHSGWDDSVVDNVSKKIAINCIKYADLSNCRLNDYKFSVDKMINDKGNTAVYLMYALARCKAILRKVPNLTNILNGEINIDNDDARNLAFKIAKYSEVINDTIEQLSPHYLCNYLYEIVCSLTKYYEKNRCIEFDNNGNIIMIHEHRIRLINLVTKMISTLFDLIGLELIEQI
jgi:arginyl-tRNA synthetase